MFNFNLNWVELFGLLASLVIAASLSMRSIFWLRLLGLKGSILFAIYGLLINSIPVILLNFFTISVHLFYLIQLKKRKDYFEIMSVPDEESAFLKRFLNFYKKEISYYFPDFFSRNLKNASIYFVFRNLNPAALFITIPYNEKKLEIILDYVTPDYRDFKNAHYIFYKSQKLFSGSGYEKFLTLANVRKHQKYLLKMGFAPRKIEGEQYFEKKITTK